MIQLASQLAMAVNLCKWKKVIQDQIFAPLSPASVLLYILTQLFTSTRVHDRITGKLLILCNFNVHHSICTTHFYKILFTKSKNIDSFSFYSPKCPAKFNFLNAKKTSCSYYSVTLCTVSKLTVLLYMSAHCHSASKHE